MEATGAQTERASSLQISGGSDRWSVVTFALPAGLLSRILMNLSLSLRTHARTHTTHTHNNPLSHIHSNTHFNSFLGWREWENSWADHCCPQGCVVQITWSFHSTLSKQLRGRKRGESQTWSTTPAARPHLNTTYARGHIYSQEYTKQKPNKHLQPPHTGTDAPEGKHQRNTWAVTHINTQGEKVCQRRKTIYHNLGMEMKL